MSDSEEFEMLDDSFGVRAASDASEPNNSPRDSPQQHRSSQSPSLSDSHHLGPTERETGDVITRRNEAPETSDIARAIPSSTRTGINQEIDPLESGGGAPWGRFHLTNAAAEQRLLEGNSALIMPPTREDPRPRPAEANCVGGGDGKRNASSPRAEVDENKAEEGHGVSRLPGDFSFNVKAEVPFRKQSTEHQQPQPPPRAATPTIDPRPKSPVASAEDEAAFGEIVGMGFERHHVKRAMKKCGRGESWKQVAISLLLDRQVSTVAPDPERGGSHEETAGHGAPQCPICLGEIPGGGVFTLDCKEQHAFCVNCLHHHCRVQLLDSGLVPACPFSNTSCGHELGQEEIERVFLLKTYTSPEGGGTGDGTEADAKVEQDNDRRALDACSTLLTRRGLESTGAIPCVSPDCGNWMLPEGGGQRVKCGSCVIEFCSSCKRAPYHYAAECHEVVALVREWSAWLTEGKTAFLETMAARDDEHKALLDEHNRKKKAHDLAVKEAERLRLEYDRMEDWKESRCRCCPKCARVIEKLSGCDLMVCGVDAHGGNVQNGCGEKFLWTQAPLYKGDRGECKTMPFTEQEPAAAARSKHFIAEGIPLPCDRCHRDVVGPLFRCIHCPSFACCLECQDTACRDPKHVHHTFQLIKGEAPEST